MHSTNICVKEKNLTSVSNLAHLKRFKIIYDRKISTVFIDLANILIVPHENVDRSFRWTTKTYMKCEKLRILYLVHYE